MSDPRPVLDVEPPRAHLGQPAPDPDGNGTGSWAPPQAAAVDQAGLDGYSVGAAFGVAEAPRRLRAAADALEDLDRGPSAQGLRLPREHRRDAMVTVDADQFRLVADLLELPDFGASSTSNAGD